ncbi:MAG TPA: excinuclease ABC subunit UvrA [Candidatus Brocadiia bacterium]|nr:excinuclease ABC subunit UvrA [Candidatus Brocadiia bacterium]
MIESIRARGVRVHNLKNLNVEIPLRKLIIVTGLSGSGKSSLAFDTLYAEGQRRYVESFSAYARQFLERMDKPEVDHIEGIPPAIAIQQKNPVKNRRSTVGTATEINDYLRLLFARAGRCFCPDCNARVKSDTISEAAASVLGLPEGTRIHVTFPITLSDKLSEAEQADAVRQMGFIRLIVDGRTTDLSQDGDYGLLKAERVSIVADRLVVSPDARGRLVDAVETCYRLGRGVAEVVISDGKTLRFTNRFQCNSCGKHFPDPQPLLFSFNHPVGACPKCSGFGHVIELSLDAVVPDKSKSLKEGCLAIWHGDVFSQCLGQLLKAAPRCGLRTDVPWQDLTGNEVKMVMDGVPDRFYGVNEFMEWMETKKYKMHIRVLLSKFREYRTCPQCEGRRLQPETLSFKVNGLSIAEIGALNVDDAHDFFHGDLGMSDEEAEIARLILAEIRKRLDYMKKVGLGYLTLDRLTRSLSGGEAQRVNLTTSLGSSLVNTLYVLDEPSIGLHPRDTHRLISILEDLRDTGNTVVVVEHDREIMKSGDQILDLGPGAGEKGGKIVFQGTYDEIVKDADSLTGRYLSGELVIPPPEKRRRPDGRAITLRGARANNLKNIDVSFPLGMLVCVTGVSGSGKSSLVQDTLYPALRAALPGGYSGSTGAHDGIEGAEHVSEVEMVDQSPIGKSPRSNPVTYIKAFDQIRKVFAGTREAVIRNLQPGAFSFNVPGGRCEHCKGDGYILVDMQFLADVYVTCDHCQGRRYTKEILDIRYKGRNIVDVLAMTVDDAMGFFGDCPAVTEKLSILKRTGLGYLRLGQPATTLSGGESQRLKLAAHMSRNRTNGMLFIFDEPTTGLHFDDIRRLLSCFEELISDGHSVIVVEHNLEVVRNSDYVIDLGPEGGAAGGRITAAGTPEEIAAVGESHTGRFLRMELQGR